MRPGCPPRPPSSRSGCWAGSRCCGARKRSRCARSAAACRGSCCGCWHCGGGGGEGPPGGGGGAPLPRQLLRLLALGGGVLTPKDVIAEALWPRRPPADTGGNIEVLVSRIRRALGNPALIRTGPGGYSLTAG